MPPKRNKSKKSCLQDDFVVSAGKKTKTVVAKTPQKTKPITKQIIQNTFLKNRHSSPRLSLSVFDKLLTKKTIHDEHFQCVLCYTTLIEPKLTKCGHTFCKKCIHESLLYRTACPVCKADLKDTSFIPNTAIQHYICEKLAEDQQQRKQYEETMGNYQSWFDSKRLCFEEIQEGMVVDVRDKDYYWVSGKILKIEENNQLVVRFTRNHSTHTETLEFDSERLARSNSILGLRQIRKIVQERSQVSRNVSNSISATFTVRNTVVPSRPPFGISSGFIFQRTGEENDSIPPFRMNPPPSMLANNPLPPEPAYVPPPSRLEIDSSERDPEPLSPFWFINLGEDPSPPPPSFF